MMKNEATKKFIVKRALDGERVTNLSKEYGISRGIIYKWLKDSSYTENLKEVSVCESEVSDFKLKNLEAKNNILEAENNLLRSQLKATYELLEAMSSQIDFLKNRINLFIDNI